MGEKLSRPEKNEDFDGKNKTKVTFESFTRVDLKLY